MGYAWALEQKTKLDNKELWHRIEEREDTKSPATFKIGDKISWKRSVGRAGYYIQPTDIPEDELERHSKEHLIDESNYFHAHPQSLERHARFVGDRASGPITLEIINAVILACSRDERSPDWRRVLKNVNYRIREEWMNEQRQKETKHPTGLRTLWYVDHELAQGEIIGKKQVWIGEFFPASGGSGYEWDEYEPAGLDVKCHQTLYEVSNELY